MSMPRAFPFTSLPQGNPSTAGGQWVFYYHPDQTIRDEPTENTELVDSGKWMLFYPKSEMDARWQEAIENMHAGRFGVVRAMKASTFKDNPRSSDSSKGVIILYTSKTSKDLVMESGRLIMEIMRYEATIYFKTNEQTRGGTIATGQVKNHTLYIRPHRVGIETPFRTTPAYERASNFKDVNEAEW